MDDFDLNLDHLDFDAVAENHAAKLAAADAAAAAAVALPDENDCAGGDCKI